MTDYRQLSREALLEELYALQRRLETGGGEHEKELLDEELRVHQIELEMQNRELRESQQQLEETRDRYADLYDFAPVGYLTLDGQGRIEAINLTGAGMLGRPRAKLIGKPFTEWLQGPDIRRFWEFLGELSRSGSFAVSGLQLVHGPQSKLYVLLEGGVVGGVDKSVATEHQQFRVAMIDITTSRKAELALRRSVAHYSSLFNDSPLPLWELDLSAVRDYLSGLPAKQIAGLGENPRRDRPVVHRCIRLMRIKDVNQAALDLTAVADKDLLRQGLAVLLTTSSWRLLATVFGLLMRGATECAHEVSLRRCDGKVLEVIVHINVAPDHGHSLGRIMLAMVDVTERYRVEKALRDSEQRFRALVEQSPLSTLLYTPEGTVKEANPACLARWGITMNDLRGYNILEDEQFEECGVMPRIQRGFEGEPVSTEEFEYDARRRFGDRSAKHWLRLHLYPVRIGGQITEVVVRDEDVTREHAAREEARQRREELAHVARLSVMGEMTSTLAHEVNQPLMAISNYAEACLDALQTGEPETQLMREALEGIVGQTDRAGQVIRRVRDFVRREPFHREAADLNEIIREALRFLTDRVMRKRVQLQFELADDLPRPLVDSVQIEQVILNIANNALDAMGASAQSKRRLTIRTASQPDNSIRVELRDTGPGIDAEEVEKVFTPFFTTKKRGMGMGLSICRTIIEGHGGNLAVESEAGRGSNFIITLPLDGKEQATP